MAAEDVHIHVHVGGSDDPRFDEILQVLRAIDVKVSSVQEEGNAVSKELEELTATVKRATSVQDSAIELIHGLSLRITESANSPKALKALAEELDTKASALAAAVQAGTPSEASAGAGAGAGAAVDTDTTGSFDNPGPVAGEPVAAGEPAAAEEPVQPGTTLTPEQVEEADAAAAAASGNTEETPTA